MTLAVHAASNLERSMTSVLWVGPRHFDVIHRRALRDRLYVTWIRCIDEVCRLTPLTFDIIILAQLDPAEQREAAESVLRSPGEAPVLVLMSRKDVIWIKDLGESSRRSVTVISDDGGFVDWGRLLSANISWLVQRRLQPPALPRCSSGSGSRSFVSGASRAPALNAVWAKLLLAKGLVAEPPVDSIRSGWTGFELDDGRLHLCTRGQRACNRIRLLHGVYLRQPDITGCDGRLPITNRPSLGLLPNEEHRSRGYAHCGRALTTESNRCAHQNSLLRDKKFE